MLDPAQLLCDLNNFLADSDPSESELTYDDVHFVKNALEQEVLVRTNKYHVLYPNFAIYVIKSVSQFLLMMILSVIAEI